MTSRSTIAGVLTLSTLAAVTLACAGQYDTAGALLGAAVVFSLWVRERHRRPTSQPPTVWVEITADTIAFRRSTAEALAELERLIPAEIGHHDTGHDAP